MVVHDDIDWLPWLLHIFHGFCIYFLLRCGLLQMHGSDNLVPNFGPLFGVGAIEIDDDDVATPKSVNLS